jgi:PAS domain S-box-containing protein
MDTENMIELLERMGFGIAIYDKVAKPVYCNSIFFSTFKKSLNEFFDQEISQFFGTKVDFEKIFGQTKRNAEWNFHLHLANKSKVNFTSYFFAKTNEIALTYKEQKDTPGVCTNAVKLNSCSIIEEAADGFFIMDKSGIITNVNSSASLLTGYTKTELLAKPFDFLFEHDEINPKPKKITEIENNQVVLEEHRILCKNGLFADVEIRSKKLSDGNFFSVVRDITNRVQIRTQLELKNQELEKAYIHVIKSEERYKQLFKNIPLGIFTASEDGTIQSMNIQMANILGTNSTEKNGKQNLFEIQGLRGSKFIEDINIALEKGVSRHKIYEYTNPLSKKTFLKAHILQLEQRAPKSVLVIVEDYTKEREKENRLRILSQGVNNSPASIVVTDEKGFIKFVNKSFLQISGYTMHELLESKPSILNSGYHPKEFYNNLWHTILSGKEWVGEFRNRKKSGELYWESAMISALKDEKGQITNFMAIKEDITRKKEVEQELKEKTEQLMTLIHATPDKICFKSYDGTWLLANATALDFFGLKGIEYYGKTNLELSQQSTKEAEYLLFDSESDEQAWIQGNLLRYETSGIDELKRPLIYEILKLPLFFDNGEKKGIVTIGRDITRRKNYEKELKIEKERAEEADTLKSAFLANMSHEIRTPLNAIMGFSSLLADYSLDKQAMAHFLEIIQVNGRQLLTIIDDILLISKLQVNQIKVQFAQFDIEQVLGKLYQQFSKELEILKEKSIELRVVKGKSGVIKIKTDRDKFQTIFSKLIRNAIKFTNSGFVEFGFELNLKKELICFVKDTGVGISPEKQQLIFQKFRQVDDSTTREYGGTGLGLSIARSLIDLLRGEIWLESELGKGTAFYFKIPLESIEIENVRIDERKSVYNWADKKVLIVDDVHESVFLLSEILKRTGIQILTAHTGIQAIEQFKHAPDIDIVLMDLQLPEMNGLEAAIYIKKVNPNVTIIMQTAFGHDGYEQRSKQAGCDDIMYKPINSEILMSKMNKFLK